MHSTVGIRRLQAGEDVKEIQSAARAPHHQHVTSCQRRSTGPPDGFDALALGCPAAFSLDEYFQEI
jgi:hypothetical protein